LHSVREELTAKLRLDPSRGSVRSTFGQPHRDGPTADDQRKDHHRRAQISQIRTLDEGCSDAVREQAGLGDDQKRRPDPDGDTDTEVGNARPRPVKKPRVDRSH
jgi:hypothetical protein